MKYKLLVLDVDGTLLDSEKKISKRLVEGATDGRAYRAGFRQTDVWPYAYCQNSGIGQLRRLHPLL